MIRNLFSNQSSAKFQQKRSGNAKSYNISFLLHHFNNIFPIRRVCLLFIIVIFIFLPLICWNLPHSSFYFRGDSNYRNFLLRNKDKYRLDRARHYFSYLRNLSAITLPNDDDAYSGNSAPFYVADPHFVSSSASNAQQPPPSLGIIFQAVDRSHRRIDAYRPFYLSQSLAALFKSLDAAANNYISSNPPPPQWSSIKTAICDVTPRQHSHHYRQQQKRGRRSSSASVFKELNLLRPYVNRVFSYRKTAFQSADAFFYKSSSKSFCSYRTLRVLHDFHFCLNRSLTTVFNSSNFVLLLHDDMLAKLHAFSPNYGLSSLVRRLQATTETSSGDNLKTRSSSSAPSSIQPKFGFLEVHTNMRHYHYGTFQSDALLELLLLSTLVCILMFFVYFRLHLRPYRFFYNCFLCVAIWLLASCIVFSVGRPHWLSAFHRLTLHFSLSDPPAHSGSGGNLLISRDSALQLVDALAQQLPVTHTKTVRSKHDGSLLERICKSRNDRDDDELKRRPVEAEAKANQQQRLSIQSELIRKLMRSFDRKVFAVYPSLFSHIGLYSELDRSRPLDPDNVDDDV